MPSSLFNSETRVWFGRRDRLKANPRDSQTERQQSSLTLTLSLFPPPVLGTPRYASAPASIIAYRVTKTPLSTFHASGLHLHLHLFSGHVLIPIPFPPHPSSKQSASILPCLKHSPTTSPYSHTPSPLIPMHHAAHHHVLTMLPTRQTTHPCCPHLLPLPHNAHHPIHNL